MGATRCPSIREDVSINRTSDSKPISPDSRSTSDEARSSSIQRRTSGEFERGSENHWRSLAGDVRASVLTTRRLSAGAEADDGMFAARIDGVQRRRRPDVASQHRTGSSAASPHRVPMLGLAVGSAP